MYKEICASVTPKTVPEVSTFTKLQLTWDTWHARMGHPGGDIVHCLPLVATGVNVNIDVPSTHCESCIMAKHPCQPHPPSSTPRVKHILDLVHSNVCGPFPVQTPHRKLYFIIFLNNHTHLINVQLLSSKDQALEAWNIVCAKWENFAEHQIKVFWSDNSGEFLSFTFKKALQDTRIEHQLSSPYSHQQNGKAEQALCTLQGHALAMLEAARLPPYLWGEAVLTAGYLWNHTESSTLPTGKTPFEMVNRRKPDLSHFHVFGSRCWAHIPSELQCKLGPQSRPALFMGYPDGVKGYRVRDRSSGAFFTTCDIIFDERNPTLADDSDDSEEEDSSPSHPTPPTIPPPTLSTTGPRRSGRECKLTEKGTTWTADLAATHTQLDALVEHCRNVASAESQEVSTEKSVDLEKVDEVGKIEEGEEIPAVVANVIIEEQAHITLCSDKWHNPSAPDYDMKLPPATYEEVMQRPDKDKWLEAMQAELQTMKDMNIYKVMKLPKG